MADEPHPQVQVLLDMLEEQNTPPTAGLTPEGAREQYEVFGGLAETEEVAEIQDFDIPGSGGPIGVRTYHPDTDGVPGILVYYHGGGHVIGSPDSHESICTFLCSAAEVLVISVDYRLAPEDPFPAALEDAYTVLEWTEAHGDDIGGDPSRLAVGGDSAGGNLAAAVSLLAADTDGSDLAHQLLIYPAVASPVVHEFDSYEENAEGYILEKETIEWFQERYVQNPIHGRNAYLAPLLAEDLSEVPPATIVTAGFDPLRDEGYAYADRLETAGVDVRHENYEGMVHAFVQLLGMLDAAEEALDMLADELASAFEE